jgi:dissimilatory sulfite reductase (desulfoviridin) alpha/beta subunit
MTDLDAITAAYMAACKDKPSDWNEIGHWYFRQAWDAAIKHERSECAKVCEDMAGTMSMFANSKDAKMHNNAVAGCAAAIRARSQP